MHSRMDTHDPNVNIHFGATDVFFYSKNEPANSAVYNIAISDPTPTTKALSYCSARSDIDEQFDEEFQEFKETIGCLKCIRSSLVGTKCSVM